MSEDIEVETPRPKRFFQPRNLSRLQISFLFGGLLALISILSLLYMKVYVGHESRLNNVTASVTLTCDDAIAANYRVSTPSPYMKFHVDRDYKTRAFGFNRKCKEQISVSRTDYKKPGDMFRAVADENSPDYVSFYRSKDRETVKDSSFNEFDLTDILHRTSFSEFETFIEFRVRSNRPDVDISVDLNLHPPTFEKMPEENLGNFIFETNLTPAMMRPQPANLDEALYSFSLFKYATEDIELKKLSKPKGSTRADSYYGVQAYYIRWVDRRRERLEDILSILFATLLGVSISLMAEAFMAGGHRHKPAPHAE